MAALSWTSLTSKFPHVKHQPNHPMTATEIAIEAAKSWERLRTGTGLGNLDQSPVIFDPDKKETQSSVPATQDRGSQVVDWGALLLSWISFLSLKPPRQIQISVAWSPANIALRLTQCLILYVFNHLAVPGKVGPHSSSPGTVFPCSRISSTSVTAHVQACTCSASLMEHMPVMNVYRLPTLLSGVDTLPSNVTTLTGDATNISFALPMPAPSTNNALSHYYSEIFAPAPQPVFQTAFMGQVGAHSHSEVENPYIVQYQNDNSSIIENVQDSGTSFQENYMTPYVPEYGAEAWAVHLGDINNILAMSQDTAPGGLCSRWTNEFNSVAGKPVVMFSLVSLSSTHLLHWPLKRPGASTMPSVAQTDCDTSMIDHHRGDIARPALVHKLPRFLSTGKAEDSACHTQRPSRLQIPSQSTTCTSSIWAHVAGTDYESSFLGVDSMVGGGSG
ncbi:hypothetical protein EDD18DRAFT_1114526 [Armillaria luteobubalina]|uniref:Uncharacterized protein n=1 Tax=Armillaria luteobubalina TaxID=153913 RepID=A0AA39TBC5_9AGAR|nr:hypothetical protein EDD18DRAFT_1114526 [Armillaria luteobubalina]